MSVNALHLAETKQSGPLFLSPSRGWIGCWFLQAPRAATLFNEREFGADSVTSFGYSRYEFSFIPVTETSTMFYLSKLFLETKTHFSIQIHRTLYVRESKPAIFLGHLPFIRTGRPDHCRTSKFNNELGFFQEFLLKNHDLLWCILFRIWLIWREWSGRSVLKSGKPPKARLQAAILKMSPHSPQPPPNSGSRAYNNLGFGIRDSRYWITDSLLVELGFRISIVIRIPKPRIPDSRSKVQIFLHRATLKHFLSFYLYHH